MGIPVQSNTRDKRTDMLNRLREARQTAQDAEYLIQRQQEEIQRLRYLLYRSFLKNGTGLQDGEINLPDTIYFDIDGTRYYEGGRCFLKDMKLRVTDSSEHGIPNRYMDILEQLEKLNQ